MNEHGSFLTLLGEIGLRLKCNWRLFDILESFGKAICSSEMFCLTHKKPSNSAKYAKKKCSNGHDRIRNVDFYFKNTQMLLKRVASKRVWQALALCYKHRRAVLLAGVQRFRGWSGWKWVKVDVNGWKWMKMDDHGWKWMKMDENGWKARQSQVQLCDIRGATAISDGLWDQTDEMINVNVECKCWKCLESIGLVLLGSASAAS